MAIDGARKGDVRAIDPSACVGCSVCNDVCPTDAIAMKPDERGFLHPQISDERCIGCGRCLRLCPVPDGAYRPAADAPLACYAAYAKNDDIRYESTSGGLFTALADSVLDQGGVVFGAAYGDCFVIRHEAARSRSELGRLRQSKYAQSDKRGIYHEVKTLLKDGLPVLFAGCPCETYALQKYLGGQPDNLLIVDFLCLGVNSPQVFAEYLEALAGKYHSEIKQVWFKNKELGWNRFSTRVEFENGRVYRKDRDNDPYMRGYIVHPLYVRTSCTNCQYKAMPHPSDITLGDYWGVESVLPEVDTRDGVSVVFVNSERGAKLMTGAKGRLEFWEVSYEDTKTRQNSNAMTKSVVLDSRSASFYEDLRRYGFLEAIERNAPDPWLPKVKRLVKALLGRTR
ncbi:Coenzyme F420 hydrogenase/dehydrogenase, beta subunit C-terminal domain [uncultured Adlercreutzia sp.]|uniref:Coenzyme F420 hydrogenase/dehydrogenase, beta subunit C-terminal domain n=1 Tax=uncultured Adlercreutzia sp. TaxID=875803 RepID=UPI0026F3E67C|nr:Coenzyme F420 hydrogenase/dehydrogenase, beta subunit C-terminal domain [uncultured Adlercreutzia sp.]